MKFSLEDKKFWPYLSLFKKIPISRFHQGNPPIFPFMLYKYSSELRANWISQPLGSKSNFRDVPHPLGCPTENISYQVWLTAVKGLHTKSPFWPWQWLTSSSQARFFSRVLFSTAIFILFSTWLCSITVFHLF